MQSSRCAGALSLRRAYTAASPAHCLARVMHSGSPNDHRAHVALPLCARFVGLDTRRGQIAAATSAAASSKNWFSSTATTSASPLPPASGAATTTARPSTFKIVNQLSKLRLSVMNGIAASGMFAMLLPFDIVNNSALFIGAILMAGSSQAANQVIEVERDRLMRRTCQRPLPTGAVTASSVVVGSALSGLGGAALLASVNVWASAVGALTWALYVGVYTPLKTRTVWNTQVGAVVGALPPLLGYCAAVGATPSLFAATLPTLVYLWQLPHFYGLAYASKEDYARGGFRMLPTVDADGRKTYGAMARASAGLAAWSVAMPTLGYTSYMFAPIGLLISAAQFYPVWRFGQHCSDALGTSASIPAAFPATAAAATVAAPAPATATAAPASAPLTQDQLRMKWGRTAFLISLASLPLFLAGLLAFGKSVGDDRRVLDSPIRRALLASPSLGPLVAAAEDGWAWALRGLSGAKPVGMCPHLTLFKHAERFCPVRIVTPGAPVAAEGAAADSASSTR